MKALKGLVKLQALVRGHIVRKQSTDMLYRMQTMVKIQARASAHRSYTPEPSDARINFFNPSRAVSLLFLHKLKYECIFFSSRIKFKFCSCGNLLEGYDGK